jgi:subtilisin family serine protease
MKKQTKAVLSITAATCIVAAGLILFSALRSAPAVFIGADKDLLVETEPISRDQSTGGSVQNDSARNDKSATDDTSQGAPSTSSNNKQDTPSRNDEITSDDYTNAPRQYDIKRSVSTETLYRALLVPNDPYFTATWAFDNLNAATAWDQSTGNPVTVAVIDGGYALSHEDLRNTWATNNGEQGMTTSADSCWTGVPTDKATNNCDDDQNGYVDDWRGWNFVLVDNNPQTGRQNPEGHAVAHGTQVAGLIGAESNNGVGTASLNWQTKLMPLQALDDSGSGYTSDVVAAIYYAVDNGADIINLSLGSIFYDPYVKSATDYAHQNNVVVVAAAGNCGSGLELGCNPDRPGEMSYPALNPHVISVGALNAADERASFSSYGPSLDVMAPGSGQLVSPMWLASNQTSAYAGTLYGTSFAAPLVSSLAALLRSERPTTSADDITGLIAGTARKVPAFGTRFYLNHYGHGASDAAESLMIAQALNANNTSPTLAQTGNEISEHSFSATSLMSSGCSMSVAAPCSIWAISPEGNERYLPYQYSSTTAGWQWQGSNLTSGEWRLRARSGDNWSATSYYLFAK